MCSLDQEHFSGAHGVFISDLAQWVVSVFWSFHHLVDGTTGRSMSVQAQTTCSTYDEIFNIHPEGDNLEQCFTAGICHSKVVGSTSINILRERMWYANWSIHAWALQSIIRAHTYIGSIMHNYSYREHTVYIESGLCLHTYFSPFTHPWLAAHWLGPAHVFVHGHSCGWTRSSAWTLQGLVPVWPVSANLDGRCVPHTRYAWTRSTMLTECFGPRLFIHSDNHRVWEHWAMSVHNVLC